jgi:hypothetical protein
MFRSIQEGQSCNVPECFRMCKPISRCPCAQWPPGATAAAVDSPGGPSRSADLADLQILQIQQICRSIRSGRSSRSGRSRQIPADPADLGRSGRSGRFRLGSADCHDLLCTHGLLRVRTEVFLGLCPGGVELHCAAIVHRCASSGCIIWARLRILTGSSWVVRCGTTQVSSGAACALLSACTHLLAACCDSQD